MKLIIALLSVAMLSTASPAQGADGTNIDVSSRYQVDCTKQDYPFVSTVYDIKKVSETASHVTFTFRTFVGSCTNNVLKVLTVNPEFVWVAVSGDGDKVEYKPSATETFVTLTFDKDDAFDDGKTESKFTLGYYPWGAYQQYFRWRILLSKNAAGSASIKIN